MYPKFQPSYKDFEELPSSDADKYYTRALNKWGEEYKGQPSLPQIKRMAYALWYADAFTQWFGEINGKDSYHKSRF